MARPTAFISFEIVGDRNGVQEMLRHVDSALSPVGLAAFLYGAVEPHLQQRAEQRFANEGDDAVGKWAPLDPITVEIREGYGFGPGPINSRTRELENYIVNGGAEVNTAEGYAILHYPDRDAVRGPWLSRKVKTAQLGKERPKTPPRPVLGMNETDLAAVMTQLAFHVKGWRIGTP